MAYAILFPNAPTAAERGAKGGRGKKAAPATGGAFGVELLRQARAVYRHTPELAIKVRDGFPLNKAFDMIEACEPSVPGVAISKRPVLALDEDEVDHDIVGAHA
jgi:hypothetical protein